jgi:hypothetical protein
MRFFKPVSVSSALALLALLSAAPAHAQMGMPGAGNTTRMPPPVKHPNDAQSAAPAPPPALPGTLNGFQPAPATATDLSPNDALFDAVNRGDIAAARDAINRGADITATNILGMTPLDVSVDLSRNNITFLLLSLRGSVTPSHRPTVAAAAAGTKTASASPAPPPKKLPPRPAPNVQPVAARQFAAGAPSDPGTPVPQAGFLGFGGTIR